MGGKRKKGSTQLKYFDADGKNDFRAAFVPASPGDGSLTFLGIAFDDARIARVRIMTGNVDPGPDDEKTRHRRDG